MFSKFRLAAVCAVGAIAVTTSLAGTAAAYADARTSPKMVSHTTSPMTVTGFNADVAKRNGYPTTPPAGLMSALSSTASPASDAGTMQLKPFGQVEGNCGFSYVNLYDVGDRKYEMDTGFGLTNSAVGYTWKVHLTAPYLDRWHNYSGGLAFRKTWTNDPNAYGTIPVSANVKAYVSTGTAQLANGFVCDTGHPTDIQAIY